eukprot:CAMPEP_0204253412 /NCGR_PEP_ID=MMETSP0468-20130131/1860_1 /ASSEMBLY_ACC=CAM_ASM_000383 /TAXON_ID=2969 /ORGANISM="Oxyrrhis marina" /LENGTH=307 /DNA_ID=CAMNT_0051226985 /DNA_START=51 /DNA_END=974 /DNA_ORIENTATION=+
MSVTLAITEVPETLSQVQSPFIGVFSEKGHKVGALKVTEPIKIPVAPGDKELRLDLFARIGSIRVPMEGEASRKVTLPNKVGWPEGHDAGYEVGVSVEVDEAVPSSPSKAAGHKAALESTSYLDDHKEVSDIVAALMNEKPADPAGWLMEKLKGLNGNSKPAEKKEEAPAEKKEEAPAEKKEEAPAEKKEEAPAEKKEEAPADKKEEAPAEKKEEAPAEKKEEAPAEKKEEATAEKKEEAPAEKKEEAPAEKKEEAPAEKKEEAPAEKKEEAPAEEKKEEAPAEKKEEAPAEKKEEAAPAEEKPAES